MTRVSATALPPPPQAREEELRAAFQAPGVDALELSTEDDVADAVLRFADMRKHRFSPQVQA